MLLAEMFWLQLGLAVGATAGLVGLVVLVLQGLKGLGRLGSIDRRMGDIDTGVTAMVASVNMLNSRIATMTAQMTAVLGRLDDHDRRLTEHEMWRRQVEARLERENTTRPGERPLDQ